MSDQSWFAAGALAALLAAAPAAGAGLAESTGTEANSAAADTIEVATNELEAVSLGFARAVADGAFGELSGLFVPTGIRLQLDGPAHAGISPRQAVASLREFLRGFEQDRTLLSRASNVDGSPDRGFAEVLWSGRAAGTSDQVRRTLFLGLVRNGGDWRVDEIRLIR